MIRFKVLISFLLIIFLMSFFMHDTIVIGTFATTQTSDQTSEVNMSAGEQLKSWGLLKGDLSGNLLENSNLTRAEMMVILSRMMLEYEKASTYKIKSSFTDGNNHWAESFIAYAEMRNWTSGIGNNMFGYDQPHTVQEAAVFMLKTLGYIPDKDFTWDTAYQKAIQLGLIQNLKLQTTSKILRGELFEIMLNTLYSKDTNSQILGEKIGVFQSNTTSVDSIKINKSSLNLAIGKQSILSATIQPLSATNQEKTWSSSNPSIVSVNNGVVIAHAEGTAIISVVTAEGGKSDNCIVTAYIEPNDSPIRFDPDPEPEPDLIIIPEPDPEPEPEPIIVPEPEPEEDFIILDINESYTLGDFTITLIRIEKQETLPDGDLRYKYIFDYVNDYEEMLGKYNGISVYDNLGNITNRGGMLRDYPDDNNITFAYYPNTSGQRFFQMMFDDRLEFLQLDSSNVRWRVDY